MSKVILLATILILGLSPLLAQQVLSPAMTMSPGAHPAGIRNRPSGNSRQPQSCSSLLDSARRSHRSQHAHRLLQFLREQVAVCEDQFHHDQEQLPARI